jgi:uncharacterized protein YkwD
MDFNNGLKAITGYEYETSDPDSESSEVLTAIVGNTTSLAHNASRKRSGGEVDESVADNEDIYPQPLEYHLTSRISPRIASASSSSSSSATVNGEKLKNKTNLPNKRVKRTAAAATSTTELLNERRLILQNIGKVANHFCRKIS